MHTLLAFALVIWSTGTPLVINVYPSQDMCDGAKHSLSEFIKPGVETACQRIPANAATSFDVLK